ncbi:MAG TPA: hypothetical protein VGC79_37475, partial [Polyangiaceae bacterium]
AGGALAGGALAGGAPAGSASAGGTASAGASGSAGSGGVVTSAGAPSEGDAGRVLIATGGANGSDILRNLAGEGGVTSELRCSCLGHASPQFCGSDGITYPIECSDGGTCLPPSVDCWHACPCLAGDDATGTTPWFSVDCLPTTQCTDGVVCMTFTNVSRDTQTICTSTPN